MNIREKEEFAKLALPVVYDLERLGISEEIALLALAAEVEELDGLNCLGVTGSRHSHFQIPQTTSDDYRERFFEIQPGKTVLAGIRHLSGDRDQPFVSLLLGFVPTTTDLPLLQEFAAKDFAKFSPKRISFWLRPSAPLAIELEAKGMASRRYIVGRLADIRQSSLLKGHERISLSQTSELDYAWYEKAYADFHAENPELKKWVPITEKEELQRCAEEGLLYQVSMDGENAGLIGGRSEPLLGTPAVYMTELLLTRSFKGQGLAPALQRKFLDSVAQRFTLVWGTIDAKNLPSTKTALKVGRHSIRTEFFLPLGERSNS